VLPRLADLDALAVTLPWLTAETRDTVRLMESGAGPATGCDGADR
jgi:hypothetical protein